LHKRFLQKEESVHVYLWRNFDVDWISAGVALPVVGRHVLLDRGRRSLGVGLDGTDGRWKASLLLELGKLQSGRSPSDVVTRPVDF